MKKIFFNFIFYLFIILGGFFAFHLSQIEALETFKVLNVIGLFYDILGLIILSEILISNERFQRFVADTLSALFMSAHFAIPAGLSITALFLSTINGFPSALTVMVIGVGFLVWALLPIFLVEDVVFKPKIKRFQTPYSRSRFFGGFLLITGLIIQFIAALQDLGI